MEKKWHVYYLPNAERTYYNRHLDQTIVLKCKVGESGCKKSKRYRENKDLGYDMTGYHVFADNLTEQDAYWLEAELQILYDCVEPGAAWPNIGRKHSDISKEKIGKAHKGKQITQEQRDHLRVVNTGKKQSDETKAKRKASSAATCIYCGLQSTKTNINRHHNDNCPHKPA